MKFEIKCIIRCDENVLGDMINQIRRKDGQILDIKQAEPAEWIKPEPAAIPAEPVQLELDAKPEYDRVNKTDIYEAITVHSRIGQKRTVKQWVNFMHDKVQMNVNPNTVAQALYTLHNLGLMRKPAKGQYVLDAVVPLESADAMIKKHNKKHRQKYGVKKVLGVRFGS